jgi:hypothetical protein
MDYRTGIAGETFPISYAWLSQLVDVHPRSCSTMKPPPRLDKNALRASFDRLEFAGLVERVRDHGLKTLVFKCLLASRDDSASNMSNPSATHEQPQRNNPETTINNNDLGDVNNRSATPCCTAMNNPIPVSGIREEEPLGVNTPVRLAPDGRVFEVFAYWQAVMEHPRAKLDGKRRRAIVARLSAGYSVDDIKQAVNGCKASPHHQGKNKQGTVYDDIELICRDAPHLERFRAMSDKAVDRHRETEDWINADRIIEGVCAHG